MTDLIDRHEAIRLLRGECVAKYPNTFAVGLFAAADEINKLPTVDAVEVVRCKDCKHMEIEPCGRYCHVWGFFNGAGDEGFCNYAERRNNA